MRSTKDINDEIVSMIERLLLSPHRSEFEVGLTELDRYYREPVCGHIRRWINNNDVGLRAHDLPLVWQAVLESIVGLIKKGDFKPRGALMGLLLNTARWRSQDLIRKIDNRVDGNVDVEVIARWDPPHDDDEVIDTIYQGFSELSVLERVTLEIWMSQTWTRAGLTREVNRRLDSDHSESSIKSALQRSKHKLRKYVERKGYFRGR